MNKFEEKELTYGEFAEVKKKHFIDLQYGVLRNIELKIGDIKNDILSNDFFNRKDISDMKKECLKNSQKNIIKYTI